MSTSETRRKKLKLWFLDRTLPTEEKSYLSQLMGGKASFGEKAARRLEKSYGMPDGYLDIDTPSINNEEAQISLTTRDKTLLELFHVLPESEADALLKTLEDKKRHYDELYKELSAKRHNKAP